MNDPGTSSGSWLKAELHAHCSADPVDYKVCDYTPEQLISEAARLGYQVLAITSHNCDIWSRKLSDYAESLGITLIPAMEVDAEGKKHVLTYNFRTASENLNTVAKIRARRSEDTLVIAPHSYFPARSCLRGLLAPNLDIFDAIEISGFHTAGLNFNLHARRIAEENGKPMVGNADVHMLWQLNKTFTWINSEPGVLPVLQAIRLGKVRLESNPLSFKQAVGFWATVLARSVFPANPRPANLKSLPPSASIADNLRLTIDD